MKLLIISTLLTFFFSNTSTAATPPNLSDIQTDIQAAQDQISATQRTISNLRTERSQLRKKDGKWGPFGTERTIDSRVLSEIQDINRILSAERTRLNTAERNLRDLRRQEQAEQNRLDQERKKQEKEKRQRDYQEARDQEQKNKQRELLQKRLQRLDVESDLSSANYSLLSAQEELSEIQFAYDKSLLGAYLQEKMRLLLNSNVMCESLNSCNGPTNPNSVSGLSQKLEEQVFPRASPGESRPARPQPGTSSRAQ